MIFYTLLYILLTTGQCNLKCKYCGGSFPPNVVPWKVTYSVKDLEKFIENDPDPIIAFYGGEPLLNPSFIMEVMDRISAKYVIQTNGLLVKTALPQKYWKKFDAVLLSIDGVEEVTDYYRGKGVYNAVLSAAKWLKSIGFKGDLIARMALSERGDIYRDVSHLLSLKLFDNVHWQLDVIWSDRWLNFDSWVEQNYKPGLRRLVNFWLREIKTGKVPGIAPFKAIVYAMLSGTALPAPPCGAGSEAFAVSTDGRVLACPIAVYEKWAELGHIKKDTVSRIAKIYIDEDCSKCPYYRYCGGRCLYAYMEKYWGEEGFRKVCKLTAYLIDLLAGSLETVKRALRRGLVSIEDIRYPPFNNTVEIIP